MLIDILYVKHAAEESFAAATNLEATFMIEDDIRNQLMSNLQVAVNLLDSTYNVGLVALKESVEVALNLFPDGLIGENYQVRKEY